MHKCGETIKKGTGTKSHARQMLFIASFITLLQEIFVSVLSDFPLLPSDFSHNGIGHKQLHSAYLFYSKLYKGIV